MKNKTLLITYLSIVAVLLILSNVYVNVTEDKLFALNLSNKVLDILIILSIMLIVYFLSNIGDGFYDKLYAIKDKALLSTSSFELIELLTELENHHKKAYSNHAKYDVDKVIVFIKNRLQQEF